MAKRELSTTLRNLKFMQRAVKKPEKSVEEEEVRKPDGNFLSPGTVLNKKCVVILEGDPHPGSVKGRMSFRNFNPVIDKLNDEAANPEKPVASTTFSGNTRKNTVERESKPLERGIDEMEASSRGKRKQPEVDSETADPNIQMKDVEDDPQSSSKGSRKSSQKPKREKLNWNVLRRPKSNNS
ncbi:hypothetical protein AKJ16_DCAP18154 [Drosera capensis]